ncbi:MAG: hypothetical protein RL740_517 [Actinomycetota bacterium]
MDRLPAFLTVTPDSDSLWPFRRGFKTVIDESLIRNSLPLHEGERLENGRSNDQRRNPYRIW